MHDEDIDRSYNVVDKFLLKLMEPQNKARILRWAWLISLGMMILGYLIIYFKIAPHINF